jgi:hypothetical protein
MIPQHITERLQVFADLRFRFDEAAHEYWLGERQLTNWSAWIKNYKDVFDREAQAPRTAAKRGISVQAVLAEWDFSEWLGTQTHAYIERRYTWGPDAELRSANQEVALRCEKFEQLRAGRLKDFAPVAQELRIFHEPTGLCGTLDFLGWHVPTQQLYVLDWKTNKAIGTDQGPIWRMLKGPFADLGDHEHNVYSLQISLYRILLEEAGILTAGGAIVHLPAGTAPGTIYQAIDYRSRLRNIIFNL